MRIIHNISILLLLTQSFLLGQVANHLVIAEIYGGGGDQGSYWTNDYVILYNPTTNSIDVSTWSIQYSKFSGSAWEMTNLIGAIPSGGYYAIQEGGSVWGIVPLPFTSNAYGTINIDKNKGKLALVSNQILITVTNPVGDPSVVDFIGYGNGTDAYEGSGPGPQLGVTYSVRRKDNFGNNTYGMNGNGWDTNDNANDLYLETDIINIPPLPVELFSFSASIIKNGIKLEWMTKTEVNNYGFEVERLQDYNIERLQDWTTIGFVQGSGNSNSPKNYSFLDESLTAGKYSYRLKQIDTDGQFDFSKVIEVNLDSPFKFELAQNYPNPFNPATTISFVLPESGNVKLTVYNIIGEQVVELVNGFREAGVYSINFDASGMNSGLYIYKLETNNFLQSRKMTLIK